jgi:hypothetical protein
MILEFWEIESPAFLALSPDAVRVYLAMRKEMDFKASNNGQVPFSHRSAEKVLHGAWRRAANALAELVHFGFIKCREKGEPGPNIRLASEWQLTAFPCGGQPPAKTFMRWQGEAFVPPYRSKARGISKASRPAIEFPQIRPLEKQLSTCNMQAPRLQHAGTRPDSEASQRVKRGQIAGNMEALRAQRRRQHAGTTTVTRREGPFQGAPLPAVPVPKPQALESSAQSSSATSAAAPGAGSGETGGEARAQAAKEATSRDNSVGSGGEPQLSPRYEDGEGAPQRDGCQW